VQFDNHAAHPKDVAMWYDNDKKWLDSVETFSLSKQALVDSLADQEDTIAQNFKQFFTGFCTFL
jgi:hypothetical protein